MAWKKKGLKGNNKFIKFEPGLTLEGIFKGASHRPSPFTEGQLIIDIVLEIEGQEKVLSSSSKNLKEAFKEMEKGTHVRVEMIAKGGKKFYNVFANE